MKSDKSRDGLHWAGWFVNKREAPEFYALLPGWWRREREHMEACRAAGRTCTLEELASLRVAAPVERPQRHVSEGISLELLRAGYVTQGDPAAIVARLRGLVTGDDILRRCTAFGEGRELLRSRPLNGLYAFVWVTALHRRGLIKSFPVNVFLDLEEGVHELSRSWLSLEDAPPELFAWLEAEVTSLLATVA